MQLKVGRLTYLAALIYFIAVTLAGFLLFWYLWLRAYFSPDQTLYMALSVNSVGEANTELCILIFWAFALVVIMKGRIVERCI